MNPKSKKPRKQRRFWRNLPLHLAQKRLAIHLNKELKKELKKTALPCRKEDAVQIVRGQFRGKTGKIAGVNYKKGTVTIEKILRKKTDGKEVLVPIQASNLILTAVERKDEARFGKKPAKTAVPKEAAKAKKEESPVALKVKSDSEEIKAKPKLAEKTVFAEAKKDVKTDMQKAKFESLKASQFGAKKEEKMPGQKTKFEQLKSAQFGAASKKEVTKFNDKNTEIIKPTKKAGAKK
ncbi:MAG: 50S ribosomal protein L24 [Candidatus Micrarchaeota archaeon]